MPQLRNVGRIDWRFNHPVDEVNNGHAIIRTLRLSISLKQPIRFNNGRDNELLMYEAGHSVTDTCWWQG